MPTAPQLQDFLGAKTEAVILGVAHGGALPRRIRALVEGLVHGVKAVALECVLRFWSRSRPIHRDQEALTREFHLRLLVLDG